LCFWWDYLALLSTGFGEAGKCSESCQALLSKFLPSITDRTGLFRSAFFFPLPVGHDKPTVLLVIERLEPRTFYRLCGFFRAGSAFEHQSTLTNFVNTPPTQPIPITEETISQLMRWDSRCVFGVSTGPPVCVDSVPPLPLQIDFMHQVFPLHQVHV